jgi:3-oxoacyl-[acyl-carrier-protein] synthase-3
MYVPKNLVTNDDLAKQVDTSDEWIRERTGIRERRIVSKGEYNSDLSAHAIQDCLRSAGIEPDEIDLIIVPTVTPDTVFPSTACRIQEKIGASKAWGFDLSGACSGFIYALATGAQFVENGVYQKVIVVGTDVMSSIVDPGDRATCVLFGDGSGAVLLEPTEEDTGIIDFNLRCDGSGGKYLHMPAGGSRIPPSHETVDQGMHYVHQDGRTVFKFAVRYMAESSLEILNKNGFSTEDLDLLVPHQANLRIIKSVADRLKLREDQVAVNIHRYSNTTAATIPISLYDYMKEGKLKKNDLVVLTSFGAGWTWGSTLLRWSI